MSTLKIILDAYKKRKRNPKIYGFHTFADPGYPIASAGPFRDNIRFFLQQCGEIEDYTIDGMPIWLTFLLHENRGFVIPLYTIEESVKNSFQPFCDQCRCSGNTSISHPFDCFLQFLNWVLGILIWVFSFWVEFWGLATKGLMGFWVLLLCFRLESSLCF